MARVEIAEGKPQFLMIGGPNGAGKSTVYKTLGKLDMSSWVLRPIVIPPNNFINPDSVQRKGGPLTDAEAGRLTLQHIDRHVQKRASFSLESTLSGLSNLRRIAEMRKLGYRIISVFIWLRSVELSMARVTHRATKGNHYIPMQNVLRRHYKSLKHFIERVVPQSDIWVILDNSGLIPYFLGWGGKEFSVPPATFLSTNPDATAQMIDFYHTGKDPCMDNSFTFVGDKTKRIRVESGDAFTGHILEEIQDEVYRQLLKRPKGMYFTYLDDQNRMVFSNDDTQIKRSKR